MEKALPLPERKKINMNPSRLFLTFFIGVLIFLTGCKGNSRLRKDAEKIADAMCRNIEVMNQLRAANPTDTANIIKLQQKKEELRNEMEVLYKEFETKYAKQKGNEKFNKDFSRELRRAMLNCPYLSKEDRENFEKEVKE
jgi:hypothetical protein